MDTFTRRSFMYGEGNKDQAFFFLSELPLPQDLLRSAYEIIVEKREKKIADVFADVEAKKWIWTAPLLNRFVNESSRLAVIGLCSVVIEMGFDDGSDVLAVRRNGAVHFLNRTGKSIFLQIGRDLAMDDVAHRILAAGEIMQGKTTLLNVPFPQTPVRSQHSLLSVVTTEGIHIGSGRTSELIEHPLASALLRLGTSIVTKIGDMR
jgi:hypothetical protein